MSVFLSIPVDEWIASNAHAFAVRDRFPVSRGHTLVITKREVSEWFEATDAEQHAVLDLIRIVKAQLDEELEPAGYNVGFNAGTAAGQTVMHLHVHVIPRFHGDVDDPRGGVRHVIPAKANYLRAAPLSTGGDDDPFARHVLPLFDRATDIAIVAAFVQESGLYRIERHLQSALRRGARVRLLTGDYLNITQASALEQLLDWQMSSADDGEGESKLDLETRVLESERIRKRAFHPKSWRFEAESFATAFVGSSNLSKSALDSGIEWNLRVDRAADRAAYARICEAFEDLWKLGRPLEKEWIDRYAERARRQEIVLPPGEIDAEPLAPAPPPHVVQLEALERLASTRAGGWSRALVVLATGLGKTWLAAFDYAQVARDLGRTPKLLFVAHRRELLRQASHTYRRLVRTEGIDAKVSWFIGEHGDLSGDLVFASVAKLARPEHLAKLANEHFDYVVVDEVHHATAGSYRKILDEIDPRFLLGLTATPDRADTADVEGLFDDNIAYRADIGRGVEIGSLVPFHYFGVKDEIDYANIPWRNRRFDADVLAAATQTEERMRTMWRAWQQHPGTRTLIFCCSITHADYVRDWLRARGVRANAVYAAPGSDDRDGSIRALADGHVDALCSVDVFNEGVDVPAIDRVVMLRPTESGVIFLQQLGRGLRASKDTGKSAVTVIDFVGNHRVFLERLRTLLSLAGNSAPSLGRVLESGPLIDLPQGCSVDLELEAKELLARIFRASGADSVERIYRELRDERDARPTAGELERMGYLPSRLRGRHGTWFEFVRAEDDLKDDADAYAAAKGFLDDLESAERMSKSFKMIALEALLEAHALREGLPVRDLAIRSHAILRRSPELFAEVAEDERRLELDELSERRWIAYWRRNPIEAWTSPKGKERAWFKVTGDRFVPAFSIPASLEERVAKLTRELVDYRLAQYRTRKRFGSVSADGFVCKVTWNKRDPILKLPSAARDKLPEGETEVRVDGAVWLFRFAKEFCNVARRAGTQANELPDLLRRWFGPAAGQPGTAFEVRFYASPDGLWAEPIHASDERAGEPATITSLIAYPDLPAAAGHAVTSVEDPRAERVFLPNVKDDPSCFAIRVSGTSMDGGKSPIHDGDWAVMKLSRGAPASSVDGRVVLVQIPSASFGAQYQIKRLKRDDGAWKLTSDNPDGPTFDAAGDMTVIASLERVFHPEDLAPTPGTLLSDDELATRFGLENAPKSSGRYGGHLFVVVDKKGALEAPDLVRFATDGAPRPGETAFVVSREDGGALRYLGVGRRTDDAGRWRIPEVDFATWRKWGEGRDTSRRLPEGALSRAQLAADALLQLSENDRWLERDGRKARVLGGAQRGGLRIDGGAKGGFAERTVSLTDLAWVIVADDDVRTSAGVLDEARVNRLRYLEGTPKGSTRWIDTGWALAAWAKAKPLVRTATAEGVLRKVRDDRGKSVDATFRVERAGEHLSVVFESRGGTRGTDAERNTEYSTGLEIILERLGGAGFALADALVESQATARLRESERRIQIEGRSYPISIEDAASLRKAIATGQAKIGRAPNARGSGNSTKRIRLLLNGPATDVETLGSLLERSSPPSR